jgi:hypothetical protein
MIAQCRSKGVAQTSAFLQQNGDPAVSSICVLRNCIARRIDWQQDWATIIRQAGDQWFFGSNPYRGPLLNRA